MAQHFHGYLAGLSLLNNKTEDDQVISCLNECQEKLELTTIDTMDDTVTPWPAHFHNLHNTFHSHGQPRLQLCLGTNLIHDFTAVTFP